MQDDRYVYRFDTVCTANTDAATNSNTLEAAIPAKYKIINSTIVLLAHVLRSSNFKDLWQGNIQHGDK